MFLNIRLLWNYFLLYCLYGVLKASNFYAELSRSISICAKSFGKTWL